MASLGAGDGLLSSLGRGLDSKSHLGKGSTEQGLSLETKKIIKEFFDDEFQAQKGQSALGEVRDVIVQGCMDVLLERKDSQKQIEQLSNGCKGSVGVIKGYVYGISTLFSHSACMNAADLKGYFKSIGVKETKLVSKADLLYKESKAKLRNVLLQKRPTRAHVTGVEWELRVPIKGDLHQKPQETIFNLDFATTDPNFSSSLSVPNQLLQMSLTEAQMEDLLTQLKDCAHAVNRISDGAL
eukprot:Nk52_evm43s62 gene=Nk52_evmTU43s62